MISIIIPMFGRAVYISACLESVLKQSYENIEVLCVMDGYSQEINKVLLKYSYDKRVKIFSIEHKCVAAARNFGLLKALGEYIIFIDADDMLPEKAIEILYNSIVEKKADVVLGDYMEIFDSGKRLLFKTPSDECDDFNSYLESVTIWNRIFRADFLFENKLFFNEKYIGGDDRIFCADSFLANPKIFVIHEIVYYWLRHENDKIESITHSRNVKNFENDLCMWNDFMDKMLEKWEWRLQDHMRYSCYYILQRFLEVEHVPEKNKCFLQLKNLVLRINWTDNEDLFYSIFGMQKIDLIHVKNYDEFEILINH